MEQISNFIIEALKIGAQSTVNNKGKKFTDEELRDDYERVGGAFSKSDKKPFMDKYATNINKIRDIQLVILDLLRENRHKKKEFDDKDVIYFRRFDIPWGRYEKAKEYLDKEPKEFLEYAFDYYFKKAKKINAKGIYGRSIADKYTMNIYNSIKKYLGK